MVGRGVVVGGEVSDAVGVGPVGVGGGSVGVTVGGTVGGSGVDEGTPAAA